MQGYTKSYSTTLKTIVMFLLILFVAYLPVSTFLFFIKNDAFNGYFPPKFFMSESIHAGYLPLWNPYINFGLPQYADMSSGYWSPITWLIASTVGYDAYTFTQEILIYLLIGGLGMYKLSGYWNLQHKIRVLAGTAYMCCGYNVGHMQHFNWLSGAAFLPWCMWGYLLLNKNFTLKNLLLAALFFYLFIASAHPGLIIGALYFFAGLSLFLFIKVQDKLTLPKKLLRAGYNNLSLLALIIVLSAGLIIGYTEILPWFSRGAKVELHESSMNPTTLQSSISFILPMSVTKNDSFFATDISMRNIYISLTLAMFFLLAIVHKKDSWQRFLLIIGGLFFLLSGGGMFKTIAYKILPLINHVRLDGEFMIFSLLCFIVVGARQLNKFSLANITFTGKIVWIYYALEILIGILILTGIFYTSRTHHSFIFQLHSIFAQPNIATKLKSCIDAITFYDTLWLQGFIQMFILWGIKRCLRKADYKMIVLISLADLCLATLLNLPFTGVGKSSVADVQEALNKSPHGIVMPQMQPVNRNDTIGPGNRLVGVWSMYNKQIGTVLAAPYPILLKRTLRYFDSLEKDPSVSLMNKNFIFLSEGPQANNDTLSQLRVNSFSPNKISVAITSSFPGQLVYQQNYYPHWFYYDGPEKKNVLPYGITFFSSPVKNGNCEIEFSFEPTNVKAGMLISFSAMIILLLLLILLSFTRRKVILL